MEQSLSELLSAAFSDASFPDEELCFEKFDERCEEDERSDRDEGRTQCQEGTGESEVLFNTAAEDVNTSGSSDDEEEFQGAYKPREANSTSSEEKEGGEEVSGVKAGELLMSLHCRYESGHKEDRTFAEGLPVAPPQVRNQEEGEIGEEEVSYFKRVPVRGNEMPLRGDGAEGHGREREGAKLDCERESMRAQPRDGPAAATLEFPEISVQSLQDLIAEVDGDQHFEKMREFSGVEHEEAGESFADYPSDFSSCEYVEDGVKHPESDTSPHVENVSVMDVAWMDISQRGDTNLCSLNVRTDMDDLFRGFRSAAVTREETGGSDSYSSSDDEVLVERRRRDEEQLDPKCRRDLEELCGTSGAAVSRLSVDVSNNAELQCEAVLTAEDTGTAAPAHVSQHPAEVCSVVESEDSEATRPIYRGSLDDGFFFDSDVRRSGVTELGALGDDDDDDDDDEEESSWEQEQERIKAFFRFYDDSDQEDEREERPIKVQFRAEPLSQVIHYDTDSSDRDSLSSSTEAEEDSSSEETSEEVTEPDDATDKKPVRGAPERGRSRELQLILKMLLLAVMVALTAMGLAMYLLAAEQQY